VKSREIEPKWRTAEATLAGPFHLLDGTTSMAKLMHASGVEGAYAVGDGFTAAVLPYEGGQESLVILLPLANRLLRDRRLRRRCLRRLRAILLRLRSRRAAPSNPA
jgi:hypothetical protein